MKTPDFKRIRQPKTNKRDQEKFNKKRTMRKCQGSKAKTTDRTQTTNTIEDQATMIEETITNLQ